MEFDRVANAESEYPAALDLAAGDLARDDVLHDLNTGLYIGNQWYLNFADAMRAA